MIIAFIPGLCPFDDIFIICLCILFPSVGIWIKKKFKWCKKSCKCSCHKNVKNEVIEPEPKPDPVLEAMRFRIHNRIEDEKCCDHNKWIWIKNPGNDFYQCSHCNRLMDVHQ